MNFFKSIFEKKVQKEEEKNVINIFLDEEIRQSETLPLTNDTTAESIINALSQLSSLKKQIGGQNTKNYYLLLLIRNTKNNLLILKRRINPFENIQEIISNKSDEHIYIWILQKQIESYESNSFKDSIIGDNFNESLFHEYRKTNEPEKYERSGRLLKRKKNGEYKEKEFVLNKDNLIYYKPGEKYKKVSVIPLVGSRAERDLTSRDKHAFEIKSTDQTIKVKAKSEVDMKGWIGSFNSQALIANENTTMNNIDKEIKYQEYKFEKTRNEEITAIINSFDKFAEKKSNRNLLLDFLARENLYYRDIKNFVETIYQTKPELEQEIWLQMTSKFLLELEDLLKPVIQKHEEIEERKQGDERRAEQQQDEVDLLSALYAYVTKDELLNRLRHGLIEIRGDFTAERKEEVTKAIKKICDYILGDLKENYNRLIQSETLFQARFTDLIKRPFFMVHDYPKSNSFDSKKDQSPMSSHISASMVSNPNYSMTSNANPNQSINLNSTTTSNASYMVN